MVEKAQEAKRKWNLEDWDGKTNKFSTISAAQLSSIASNIDVVLQDGNPSLINHMMELDLERNKTSVGECKQSFCSSLSDSDPIGAGKQIRLWDSD